MESGHAEASSMAATAAARGDLDHFGRFNGGLSIEEHYELVKSVLPHRGSVGRVILVDEKTKEIIQTGTASLVYKGDERSLFITCNHNFGQTMCGQVIRLLDGNTVKDYPIEHIVYRHVDRDLLFFSVKDRLPQHKCLEFSTDELKREDKVVLLGFSGVPLQANNIEVNPAPVLMHSILTGVVRTDPYKSERDQHHEKVYYNCNVIQGHSGSPVFKNGNLAAIHIAADKNWRDGISSCYTVMHSLREHLELGTDKEATIVELLEGLYKKSGHVPYAEVQYVKDKSKRKRRR